MKIVLFEPDIPQNTGNIIRTCSVTGCSLYLVKPLGFRLSHRLLKRSGLDYHEYVNVNVIDDFGNWLKEQAASLYFFSSKATKTYTDCNYSENSVLIFGSETSGLPKWLWDEYRDHFVTLPMKKNQRCLNLANSVSIAIYEAWRQQNFIGAKN